MPGNITYDQLLICSNLAFGGQSGTQTCGGNVSWSILRPLANRTGTPLGMCGVGSARCQVCTRLRSQSRTIICLVPPARFHSHEKALCGQARIGVCHIHRPRMTRPPRLSVQRQA